MGRHFSRPAPKGTKPGTAFNVRDFAGKEYDWVCPQCKHDNHTVDRQLRAVAWNRSVNWDGSVVRRCGHCHQRSPIKGV